MQYCVYVIDLDPAVLSVSKFARKNPDYVEGKPCVYVGQTSKTPEERFKQHLEGDRFYNRYVREYGRRIRPMNYEKYNHIGTREEAENIEEALARRLQARGYGVWWG